jgi:hypothetical protein
MVSPRFAALGALVVSVFSWTASAWACPARGGGEVAVEPELSQAEALIEKANALEVSASQKDKAAMTERTMARKKRQLAANLREQVQLNPEADRDVLLARATLADRDAVAAEGRAKTHTKSAKALRTRAAELRTLARQLDTM